MVLNTQILSKAIAVRASENKEFLKRVSQFRNRNNKFNFAFILRKYRKLTKYSLQNL